MVAKRIANPSVRNDLQVRVLHMALAMLPVYSEDIYYRDIGHMINASYKYDMGTGWSGKFI